MSKNFLRTNELAEILGVAPTTLAGVDEALGLNTSTGVRGKDRIYCFREALIAATYFELSKTFSYATARQVAADLSLKWDIPGFFEKPVAIIHSGSLSWRSVKFHSVCVYPRA